MLNTVVELEVYKKVSGESDYDAEFEDTPTIVYDLNSCTTKFGIEKVKDSIKFSIPVQNRMNSSGLITRTNNTYNIKMGDLVKLYAYNAPMEGSKEDHLLMVAYVKSDSFNSSQGSGKVSFTCYNRSEVLLNNKIFITKNEGEQVPNMLVEAVNRIKTYNQKNIIEGYKDYSGLSTPGTKGAYNEEGVEIPGKTGYIRAYKDAAYNDDGTLKFGPTETIPTTKDNDGYYLYFFEEVVFVESYKSFIQHLDDLSTPEYTGEVNKGTYIYYVDGDNNVHWEPKTFINVSSKSGDRLVINEFEESSVNMSRDLDDVVNAIIINCGPDPNEAGILTFAFDASSMGKNGAKWTFEAKTNLADTIREKEIKSGVWSNDEGIEISGSPNSPNYIDDDNYPNSFPWTIQTSGTDKYGAFSYTANSTTVTSRDEYREYFRNITKLQGTKYGNKLLDYGSDPLLKGTYELEQGTNKYVSGDILKIVIPSIGMYESNEVLLRIMSVDHNFQGGMWTTALNLEEDRDMQLVGEDG